jgi:hypothetical protein
VGYGAIIDAFHLKVPLPCRLALISGKHKRYEEDEWIVLTPRHLPEDNLNGHLTFALKYEGLDLHVLKALFSVVSKKEISDIITGEPTGQYSRRIWFLYEWLSNTKLDIPDAKTGNFVDVLDPKLQYEGPSEVSKRHRVRNNLPGVRYFCPLIRRTETLDRFFSLDLSEKLKDSLDKLPKDLLIRASSFLLLKDSKASYAIEGESPTLNRALRWGRAISQAGNKPLSNEELLRLQHVVIENDRFTKLGFRKAGGFIGEHDRSTGTPIPDHISARWQDINSLIEGLINTKMKLQSSGYPPVLAATAIAFGFVFIHPFVDGNGRIHRYLIHHVLSKMGFSPKGLLFPVSSAILERIDEYRQVLEAYSHPRLDLIKWKPTQDNNIEILNETIDLYRYFDATRQADFLFSCVEQTINEIIPAEVKYLRQYDRMKAFTDDHFEMPDKTIALLVRFLEQGNGKLPIRARKVEFKNLTDKETLMLEEAFKEIFLS